MKREIKAFLKIVLLLAVCICLYWIGDVWRAASHIEWYKLAGATALVGTMGVISFLSIYGDMRDKEYQERFVLFHATFSKDSFVGKFVTKNKLDEGQKSALVEIALRKYVSDVENGNKPIWG